MSLSENVVFLNNLFVLVLSLFINEHCFANVFTRYSLLFAFSFFLLPVTFFSLFVTFFLLIVARSSLPFTRNLLGNINFKRNAQLLLLRNPKSQALYELR